MQHLLQSATYSSISATTNATKLGLFHHFYTTLHAYVVPIHPKSMILDTESHFRGLYHCDFHIDLWDPVYEKS